MTNEERVAIERTLSIAKSPAYQHEVVSAERYASDVGFLLEQLDAAQKDVKRLDWMESRSRVEVEPYLRPDCGALISFEPENEVPLRQMIDTAMRVKGRDRCLCQGTTADVVGSDPRCRSCGGVQETANA